MDRERETWMMSCLEIVDFHKFVCQKEATPMLLCWAVSLTPLISCPQLDDSLHHV